MEHLQYVTYYVMSFLENCGHLTHRLAAYI